jgi:two-component system chemotaxis sensor kinase CheA
MGGSLTIEQRESGTETVIVRVPANPAFMDAMVVRIGDAACAIPSAQLVEVVRPARDQITTIKGIRVLRLEHAAIELIDGRRVFGGEPDDDKGPGLAAVVRAGGSKIALGIDRALGRQEVVLRQLDPSLQGVGPIRCGGAAGDGATVVVVDVPGLVAQRSAKFRVPSAE